MSEIRKPLFSDTEPILAVACQPDRHRVFGFEQGGARYVLARLFFDAISAKRSKKVSFIDPQVDCESMNGLSVSSLL
jgi:hypothetical protein